MFFFFPINTDAPVYHFPWATLSLILANCFVFAAIISGALPVEDWVLNYGHIAPAEWVTSNFVHGGIGHLLGNMLALWGLGLIVEGKIGWRRFLLIYLGVAVTECAIEQLVMLGSQGSSAGASSAIFGLTAMALVWAPKNELSFVYFVWILVFFRMGVFEISVMTYSMVVLAIELLVFTIQGFHVGSAALHLLGALVGYGVGLFMLKQNMVDCEGWDLFSVLKGTNGRIAVDPLRTSGYFSSTKKRRRKRKKSRLLRESDDQPAGVIAAEEEQLSRTERCRRRILKLIADRKPGAAFAELRKQQHVNPAFRLEGGPLRKLAQGMIEHEQWADAVELLEEYVVRFDRDLDPVRVQLALLLLRKQRRPRAALKVLDAVEESQLSAKLQGHIRQIRESADAMVESGVIELSGQAFSSE